MFDPVHFDYSLTFYVINLFIFVFIIVEYYLPSTLIMVVELNGVVGTKIKCVQVATFWRHLLHAMNEGRGYFCSVIINLVISIAVLAFLTLTRLKILQYSANQITIS